MKNRIVFALLLVSFVIHAAEKSKIQNVPPLMYLFRTEVMEMFPHATDVEAFSEKSKRVAIQRSLDELAKISGKLLSHERLKTDGFVIPAMQIQQDFNAASKFYRARNYPYAWRKYRTAVHGCSNCHTQVGNIQAPKWEFDFMDSKASAFETADFLFTIRDYSQALEKYRYVISQAKQEGATDRGVESAIKRSLTIYLHIDRSPARALAYLDEISKERAVPSWMLSDMERWKTELRYLAGLKPPASGETDPGVIEAFADGLLREVYPFPKKNRSREIAAMFASGIILEFLNKNSGRTTPGLLYWVGTILDDPDPDLFLTLGDEYLRRCITQFASDPKSRLCLLALRERWALGFTGSSGTHLPRDIIMQLQELESLIKETRR